GLAVKDLRRAVEQLMRRQRLQQAPVLAEGSALGAIRAGMRQRQRQPTKRGREMQRVVLLIGALGPGYQVVGCILLIEYVDAQQGAELIQPAVARGDQDVPVP